MPLSRGGVADVLQDRVAVGDGLLARPGPERVAERVHVGVGPDAGVAEQVPRAADRRRVPRRSRTTGPGALGLQVVGGADAGQAGADDQDVEVLHTSIGSLRPTAAGELVVEGAVLAEQLGAPALDELAGVAVVGVEVGAVVVAQLAPQLAPHERRAGGRRASSCGACRAGTCRGRRATRRRPGRSCRRRSRTQRRFMVTTRMRSLPPTALYTSKATALCSDSSRACQRKRFLHLARGRTSPGPRRCSARARRAWR